MKVNQRKKVTPRKKAKKLTDMKRIMRQKKVIAGLRYLVTMKIRFGTHCKIQLQKMLMKKERMNLTVTAVMNVSPLTSVHSLPGWTEVAAKSAEERTKFIVEWQG